MTLTHMLRPCADCGLPAVTSPCTACRRPAAAPAAPAVTSHRGDRRSLAPIVNPDMSLVHTGLATIDRKCPDCGAQPGQPCQPLDPEERPFVPGSQHLARVADGPTKHRPGGTR